MSVGIEPRTARFEVLFLGEELFTLLRCTQINVYIFFASSFRIDFRNWVYNPIFQKQIDQNQYA